MNKSMIVQTLRFGSLLLTVCAQFRHMTGHRYLVTNPKMHSPMESLIRETLPFAKMLWVACMQTGSLLFTSCLT